LEQYDVTTKAVSLSFLAVDPSGEHETGDPVVWKNTIAVKHRLYQDGAERRCELQAIPVGTLRYTTDGSGPENHGQPYGGPFVVPDDCRVVLAQAEADGVRSEVMKFDVPPRGQGGAGPVIDPAKPATWRRAHKQDSTHEVFDWLEKVGRSHGAVGEMALVVMHGERWIDVNTSAEVFLPAGTVVEQAGTLKELLPEGNLNLEARALQFETGRDLQELVRELKAELKPGEVRQ
jgi:hypothetical protein